MSHEEAKGSSLLLPSLLDFTFTNCFSPAPSGERLLTALRGIDKNEKSKWTWNVLVGEHPPLGLTGVLLHSGSLHLSGSQFDLSCSHVLVLGRKCRFCPASLWRKSLLFYTYIYFSFCLNAGVSVNAVGDWGQREPRSDLTVHVCFKHRYCFSPKIRTCHCQEYFKIQCPGTQVKLW